MRQKWHSVWSMAEEKPAEDVPAGATAADVSVKNTTLYLFIESTTVPLYKLPQVIVNRQFLPDTGPNFSHLKMSPGISLCVLSYF